MKIALISDIHGNYVALTAVLQDLERHQPDKLICLGDVATVGSQPKEVLATLQTLDCTFIQGNHDAALLQPEKASDYNIHPALHDNLAWVVSELAPENITFLQAFLPTYELNLGADKTMLCFHATPQNNIDNIINTTPTELVDSYLQETDADVLVGGHTHIQMLRMHHGRLLINAGSVGNSFIEPPPDEFPRLSPWAEYALVEQKKGTISVHFHRLPLDIEAVYAAARASKMPNTDWWLKQY